jgi:RNA polymerase primary sigma factor
MKARVKKVKSEASLVRKKYPVLGKAKELDLFTRIRLGDEEAREMVILHNTGFVVSTARKYEHRGLPIDDLKQEGYLGLLVAVDKFDPSQGVKFISYAVWWITQYMRAAVRLNKVVREPERVTYLKRAIRAFCNTYLARFHHEPSREMIAHMFKIEKEHVELYLGGGVVSLDKAFSADTGSSHTLHDTMSDESVEVDQRLAISTDVELVLHTLDQLVNTKVLKKREREIFLLRSGFTNVERCPVLLGGEIPSLVKIGKEYKINRERARQLYAKALKTLRFALNQKIDQVEMKGLW